MMKELGKQEIVALIVSEHLPELVDQPASAPVLLTSLSARHL